MSLKTLCMTLGDPCGLGPELVVRHFADETPRANERLIIIGPEVALKRELNRYGVPQFHEKLDSLDELQGKGAGIYLFEPPELSRLGFPPGKAVVEGGLAAGASLDDAVSLLNSGVADGLVTCPLNKAMLQKAGYKFPGHTEFLAEKLGVGADKVCMHLCGHDPHNHESPKLRVSLVTTHPRLKDVPGLVTRQRILHCLRLTADFVRAMKLDGEIAVCGLNPHAGESGRIGDEEIKTISPAIEAAKEEGLKVAGPIPADTLFHFAAKGDYPAVLAMYHDQGLGPLKLLHFSEAVNVTLGLPCPRTSPDHGTGYDLVGTGRASIKSFQAALDMARRLVEAR
ncbi:4-hydroxythreonine-4-phosphate dehydrogenase PdxA [Pseudodesulfovibrio sp. zrk46]|uniref:4-hydroxythreonine-4-phosphate dehydrogenase PdxA n=1 Tax=Pseudodesulfovibrio sp. zrk46 TaxID=2725288 RepID=UPI001449E4A8|nr:4-hydroxythreonine-4-phosphate dehydrogenase PdxA [Pseudodesulfovibrio sp. zrk46]QJB58204.1 4-hydroxythreonine-4-phosphate dehydrogenase PdxA [Pseudodesulfovibrio sp. zrk46]